MIYQIDEPVAAPASSRSSWSPDVRPAPVKVVLGGQGGDEIFGGYARYLVAYLEQAIKGAYSQSFEEAEHIVSLQSIVPNLPSLRQYAPMLQQFWQRMFFEPMDRRYFRGSWIGAAGRSTSSPMISVRATIARRYSRSSSRCSTTRSTKSYYNKMTHFDLVTGLPALLHVEDRVSMAASLESRVPLLDVRIADLVTSMPPRMKFRGGELKYILKRATTDLLPAPVALRKDKMGFPVPLHLWAKGASHDFFADVLLSLAARERGLFEPRAVERLLEDESAFGRRLWGLLNLELWFREFIDA